MHRQYRNAAVNDLNAQIGHILGNEMCIRDSVYTDMPGMQLYSGNFMHGDTVGKDGYVYKKRDALCLETQYYPDAINFPQWPSPILRAGEDVYKRQTYKRY